MKTKSKSKPNLSDKISAALTAHAQPLADPEDDVVFRTKPRFLTRDELSGSEDEAAISDFRRRNVKLLSELGDKYKGEVVSKRDLGESSGAESDSSAEKEGVVSSSTDIRRVKADSDESESEEGESDDNSITQSKTEGVTDSDEGESGTDGGSDGESGSDQEGYDISQMEEPPKETFEHMKKQNVSEEVKKGNCVRSQLLIWEGLLEMRIHMQRCLNTANQMPTPEVHRELRQQGGTEFLALTNAAKANVSQLLDKLLNLQKVLLKNFTETKNVAAQSSGSSLPAEVEAKLDSDEEIPSDDEEIPSSDEEIPSDVDKDETGKNEKAEKESKPKENGPPAKKRKLQDYEKEISSVHKSFTAFRNSTIQKWYDKTRTTTATSHKNAPTNSVLSQIDFILSDRDKLVRRTQLKRSEYNIVGYKKEPKENTEKDEVEINPAVRGRKDDDEYIPEIFDDSDFYHQILRELIECKSADISDPVQLSRQWIALQQMRSKMKRKVDTKATKGRRIKYVVHNKLINFMAPEKASSWTDESRNELYSSLFGKMFENSATEYSLKNGFSVTTDITKKD